MSRRNGTTLATDQPSRLRPLASHPAVSRVLKAMGPDSTQLDESNAILEGIGGLEPPLPLESLLSLYEENAFHGACINAKAEDTVASGWELESESTDENTGEKSSDDAAAEESAKTALETVLRPLCKKMPFEQLLLQAATETGSLGWGAWEIRRGTNDALTAIYPLPGQTLRATIDEEIYVQVIAEQTRYFLAFGSKRPPFSSRDKSRPPSAYTYQGKRKTAEEDRCSEVLVFLNYSARSTRYGFPSWSGAIPAITEMAAIREFNLSNFVSGNMIDRLITVTAKNDESAMRAADSIREQIENCRGNAHATLIISGTTDLKAEMQAQAGFAGASTREASFVRRREDLVKEILIAHRVPPYRIGWAEIGSLGGNAAKEMLRAYRFGAIEPLQTIFETAINEKLFGSQGIDIHGYRWKLVDIDWEEMETYIDSMAKQVDGAILTPNEARSRLRMQPVQNPAMDRFYLHGTSIERAGDAPAGSLGGTPFGAGRLGADQSPGAGTEDEEKRIVVEARNRAEEDDRRLKPLQGLARKAIGRAFKAERARVLAALDGTSLTDLEKAAAKAVDAGADDWRDVLVEVAEEPAAAWAERSFDDLKRRGILPDDAEPKTPPKRRRKSAVSKQVGPDFWLDLVRGVIGERAGDKVVQITATTKDQLRGILKEAVEQGLGVNEIRDKVDELYLDQIIPNRSEVIARTEVISAANEGSHLAHQASGLDLEKKWIDTGDDRTREAHREAGDGPWIPLDEPFDLGGYKLMYPGDSSLGAPGELTIQCRCTQVVRERKTKKKEGR